MSQDAAAQCQLFLASSFRRRAGTRDGVRRRGKARQCALYWVNQPFSGSDIVWLARDVFAPRDSKRNRNEVAAAGDARSKRSHDLNIRDVLSRSIAPHTVIAMAIAGVQNFFNTQALHSSTKSFIINAVPISQEIARCRVKGKGLDNLLCCPLGTRVLCDVEVNNLAPVMSQNNKHVQDPKCDRGYSEEINRDQVRYMIIEKRSPGLGRRFLMTNHVFRYGGFRYINPQHAQFAVNSGRTPTYIVS